MVAKLVRLAWQLWRLLPILDVRSQVRFFIALLRSVPDAVATRGLGKAYRLMWNYSTMFRVDGVRITLPGTSFGYAAELYARKVYTNQPGFLIEPGMVVVDLGAAVGVFSVYAAARGARVVAVEPNLSSCEAIRNSCALNNLSEVSICRCAVGATTGDVTQSANAQFYHDAPVRDLSSVLSEHGIRAVDFLKIDIEGSEFGLFQEGEDAWLPLVHRIAMEVHPEFGDAQTLSEKLRSHNFLVRMVDLNGRVTARIGAPAGYLFAWRA